MGVLIQIKLGLENLEIAPLAQLDRVSDYESEGHRFESYMVRHLKLCDYCNHRVLFCIKVCIKIKLDFKIPKS